MNHTPIIPFAKPSISDEEIDAVTRIMRSGWLTTGKECLAFEHEFATMLQVPHAIAVNSATAGLHLAVEALGIGQGDSVIMSPYTFTASAEIVHYVGATVAFIDVAPGTFHLCPHALKAYLQTPQAASARAIMLIHIGGIALFYDEIIAIAQEHNLYIIEDAAHSLPARSKNIYDGTKGDIGIYSFYATKTITTGEGGMIVCHDENLARRMRLMRLHGITHDVWERYTNVHASWSYDVSNAGFKYNLTDIAAAIGRVQLKKAHAMQQCRATRAYRYNEAFKNCPGLILPPSASSISENIEKNHHSWHLYMLRINPHYWTISRDEIITHLQHNGITVSVHFIPLHCFSYYQKKYHYNNESFHESYTQFATEISLPLYPQLEYTMQDIVIYHIKKLFHAYGIDAT